MVLRALHLCSGYGGFELAFRLAGVPLRTVAHVERDSHAAATLVTRMEDQALDRAPVWSNIETFDGGPWRGRVDLVTAGFPCPDFSAAGRRAGVHGDHWLWPECARVIREVAPSIVFLENVPGLVRLGGLTRVLSDLAGVGFDAEWGLLSAAAVGASHQRERFWLLAYAEGIGRLGRLPSGEYRRDIADASGGPHVGHSGSSRRSEVTRGAYGDETPDAGRSTLRSDIADGPGEDVANPRGVSRQPRLRPDTHQRQGRRDDTPADSRTWPPLPDDIEGWEQYVAEGGPEPQVRRSTNGRPLGLADALHLGGNGLVPRVAAEAFGQLAVRLGLGEMVPVEEDVK